jgi:hypothetical protein
MQKIVTIDKRRMKKLLNYTKENVDKENVGIL